MKLINGHGRNHPRTQSVDVRNDHTIVDDGWIVITEWVDEYGNKWRVVDEKCRDRKTAWSSFK